MKRSVWYAHSRENRPEAEWQPLEDHLYAVAEMARRFAEPFGMGDWAYLAGLWHDLGKYAEQFQHRVLGASSADQRDSHVAEHSGRVDHSTAGAQWAVTQSRFGILGRLISYAIAGHHSGLPNFRAEHATSSKSTLEARIDKDVPQVVPPGEIGTPTAATSPTLPHWIERADGFTRAFAIRMVFSCLVDADFLDTEAFYDASKQTARGHFPSIDALRDRIAAKVASFATAADRNTVVNQTRQAVSDACVAAANLQPGLFSLTVPTGGGKTLASMRFALHHATQHGKRRIIYAIPYTTIIEQTASVFRETLGDDAVVEHHSRVEVEEDHETSRTRLASENWDAPLIVTTNVQFFESLFANRTGRCRKLHNIADSIIVLDEAQMLPVSLLTPTLAALRELVDHYGCSVVLCTATQPALTTGPHLVRGLTGVREIVPQPRVHFEALERVEITYLGEVKRAELANRLAGYDQALCVVNTRRDAQELYQLLTTQTATDGCYYLSTYLCPAHRDAVFAEIRERLATGLACRVVSTQLIEAGVDIDFPVVFRAMTGIDSILQAAGRCNRHGTMSNLGQVFVFTPENPPPKGFLARSAAIGKEIVESGSDIADLTTIERYFAELYSVTGGGTQGDGLDQKRILKDLIETEGAHTLCFQFQEIATRYRLIDQQDVPIVVRYRRPDNRPNTRTKSVDELIERLRHTQSRGAMRDLQPYIVNVPQRVHRELVRRGDVALVVDTAYVLERSDLYDPDGAGFVAKEFGDIEPGGLVV